jgi:hypothetical protein
LLEAVTVTAPGAEAARTRTEAACEHASQRVLQRLLRRGAPAARAQSPRRRSATPTRGCERAMASGVRVCCQDIAPFLASPRPTRRRRESCTRVPRPQARVHPPERRAAARRLRNAPGRHLTGGGGVAGAASTQIAVSKRRVDASASRGPRGATRAPRGPRARRWRRCNVARKGVGRTCGAPRRRAAPRPRAARSSASA